MPEERRGKNAKPDCWGTFDKQPATVRASVCNASCPVKKTCVQEVERRNAVGNTTLSPGYQPQSDPRVAQWEHFWGEMVSALRNNPSTGEIAEWMEQTKRQRLG